MDVLPDAAYVYMVRCTGGQLYTGWTNHPAARLKAHLPVRMRPGTPAQKLRRAVPGAVVYEHRLEAIARPLRAK